ncbi:uncharacterized protein TNCV_226531 [Trichonephila clavipes]|nr:uncharacterized protein TNCV_226531 [Trichonephila clavipes]
MLRTVEGCGSPVVKVSNHGRHVTSSSPVPLKIRRVGERCTLNLSRAETSSRRCGVVVRREGFFCERIFESLSTQKKRFLVWVFCQSSSMVGQVLPWRIRILRAFPGSPVEGIRYQ